MCWSVVYQLMDALSPEKTRALDPSRRGLDAGPCPKCGKRDDSRPLGT
jgi:hypothetical protein